MEDEARLEEMLLVMGELCDKEMSLAFLATYKRVLLNAMSAEDACKGIEIVLGMRTFGFPKPADIIEAVKGKPEDLALSAWQMLLDAIRSLGPYKSVIFSDARLIMVVEAMGGWMAVNAWLEEEMPFRRAEFMKLYAAARPGEPKKLAGIVEAHNAAHGYLDHVPNPVIAGKSGKLIPVRKAASIPYVEAVMPEVEIPADLKRGLDSMLNMMGVVDHA